MPEEFTLQQLLGNSPAVDGDERFVLAIAVIVEGTRNEFLAGTTLAVDQHGAVSIRDLLHLGKDRLHLLAIANNVIELIFGFELLTEAEVFVMQVLKFKGALDHHE